LKPGGGDTGREEGGRDSKLCSNTIPSPDQDSQRSREVVESADETTPGTIVTGDPLDAESQDTLQSSETAFERGKRTECAQFESNLDGCNQGIIDNLLNQTVTHAESEETAKASVSPDVGDHDLDMLADLLDMDADGLPISWPKGLNRQLASDIIESDRKRRKLHDG
jgi:hypothetical protein